MRGRPAEVPPVSQAAPPTPRHFAGVVWGILPPLCIGLYRPPTGRLSPTCVGCVAVPSFFRGSRQQTGVRRGIGGFTPPFPHGILGQMAWRLAAFPPGRPHRGAPILCPSRKSGNPVNRERAEKRRKSLLSFIIWAGQQVAQCAAISPPLGANASASLPAQLSY